MTLNLKTTYTLFFLFLLILSTLTPSSIALEAEEVEGFPIGPVLDIEKIQYDLKNDEPSRTTWKFDSIGNPSQINFLLNKWEIKALCSSDLAGNITEVTFYQQDRFDHRDTYQYNQSEIQTKRTIEFRENDYRVLLFQHQKKGNLIYRTVDNKTDIFTSDQLEWDAQGNKTKSVHYESNQSRDLVRKIIRTYLPQEKVLETLHFEKDTILDHFLNHYDDKGNLFKGCVILDDHEECSDYDNTYDGEGRLLEQVSHGWRNLIYKRETYTYHSNNSIQSHTVTDYEKGQVRMVQERKMDPNGNLVEEYQKWSDGDPTYKTWEYDEQNRVIRMTLQQGNKHCQIKENLYNSKGQLQEELTYNIHNQLNNTVQILYTYDAYGNMTQKQTIQTKGNDVKESRTAWTYNYCIGSTLEECLNLAKQVILQ